MKQTQWMFAGLVTAILVASPAWSGAPARRSISVQGTGEIRAVPDVLHVDLTFRAEGKSVDPLRNDVDGRVARFADRLAKLGVGKKHYTVLQPTVQPQYTWDKVRKLTGFRYLRQVRIELTAIARYSNLVDAALDLGAEMSGSPRMAFSNRDELELQALEAAVSAARAKAQRLAAAAGASLGPVLDIQETGAAPVPRPMMMAARAAETANAPVEHLGAQTIRRTVQVRFALR